MLVSLPTRAPCVCARASDRTHSCVFMCVKVPTPRLSHVALLFRHVLYTPVAATAAAIAADSAVKKRNLKLASTAAAISAASAAGCLWVGFIRKSRGGNESKVTVYTRHQLRIWEPTIKNDTGTV